MIKLNKLLFAVSAVVFSLTISQAAVAADNLPQKPYCPLLPHLLNRPITAGLQKFYLDIRFADNQFRTAIECHGKELSCAGNEGRNKEDIQKYSEFLKSVYAQIPKLLIPENLSPLFMQEIKKDFIRTASETDDCQHITITDISAASDGFCRDAYTPEEADACNKTKPALTALQNTATFTVQVSFVPPPFIPYNDSGEFADFRKKLSGNKPLLAPSNKPSYVQFLSKVYRRNCTPDGRYNNWLDQGYFIPLTENEAELQEDIAKVSAELFSGKLTAEFSCK